MPALRSLVNGPTADVSDVNQYRNLSRGGREYDVVNGYGADPSGVADSYAAINQAITDCQAAGGGTIYLPWGIYDISQELRVTADYVHIVGAQRGDGDTPSKGTVIRAHTGFAGTGLVRFEQSGTPVKPLQGCGIRHLSINGNAKTGTNVTGLTFNGYNGLIFDLESCLTSGDGIIIRGIASPVWTTYNTKLLDVHVHDVGGYGINFTTGSTDAWMDFCTVYESILSGVRMANSGINVLNTHIYSNHDHGVLVDGSGNASIRGCYIENNYKHGVFVDNSVNGTWDLRISQCLVWANGWPNNNLYDAIAIALSSGGAGCKVSVRDCSITVATGQGVNRYGVNLGSNNAQQCAVEANTFSGSFGTAPINASGNIQVSLQCSVRNNQNWNPVGLISSTSPAGVGSGVVYQNPSNYDCTVYIQGGTVSVIQIPLPAPTITSFSTATTGGSLAPGTYFYQVTALGKGGETLGSVEASKVVPAGTSTNTVTINWDPLLQATSYNIYGRVTGGSKTKIANVLQPLGTYVDTGVAPSGALPTTNTTGITGMTLASGQFVSLRIPAGQAIAVTYSVAPTWNWFAD